MQQPGPEPGSGTVAAGVSHLAAPMIEPFFFGPAGQRVFATFHPSTDGRSRGLTIICPPLLSEYMRVHSALRELAVSLTQRGHDVLRIDYTGTGDSDGDLSAANLSDWTRDIALAVREGRNLSGSATVRLVGVRAGALLACHAMGLSQNVNRFVLWDPIVSGAGYVDALRRIQRTMLGRTLVSPVDRAQAVNEFAGYRLSGELVDELRSLDANVYATVPVNKLHVVETATRSPSAVPGAIRAQVAFNCDWECESEDQLMPRLVLEQLTSCLTAT